jgi:hypoxanthine phosphoribosyltransferase
MPVIRGKVIEPLFTPEAIAKRNDELAAEIAKGPTQTCW